MRNHASKRVFILGAGASAWAGFPLGRGLWSFLADHTWVNEVGMEFLHNHLVGLSPADREGVSGDLEALLTRIESRAIPPPSPRATPSADAEAHDVIAHLRHLRAQQGFNLRRFTDILRRRIENGIVSWPPIAMQELVGSIARAFLCHHMCVAKGKDCYRHAFGEFIDEPTTRCPCFGTRTFAQANWRMVAALVRAFRPGDTIITFNWECLLEVLLFSKGLWSPVDGYGVPVRFGGFRRSSAIQILKPHGSINWRTTAGADELGLVELDRLFGFELGWSFPGALDEDFPDWPFIRGVVLSPTYNKHYYDHRLLSSVWNRAIDALSDAKEIVVIGYSLPPSDQTSRELLAYGLRRNTACSTIQLVTRDLRESHWTEFAQHNRKEPLRIAESFEEWVRNAA